jgi:hypothetical protein
MRVSKKRGIEDSMLNLKRDDGVSNSFEPPIGNKDEIF